MNGSMVKSDKLRIRTMVVAVISMICLFVLMGIARFKVNDKSPLLLFYGFDNQTTLPISLSESIAQAGFRCKVDSSATSFSDYDNEENIVLVLKGKDITKQIREVEKFPNVKGYILINPVFPGNIEMNDFGKKFPNHSVAVFAPKLQNEEEVSDAEIWYEKLSGDDTKYGLPVKHKGLFSSTIYISADQQRYLSLSGVVKEDNVKELMGTPFFQMEMAQYLGNNFSDVSKVKFNVNNWFVFLVMRILLIGLMIISYFFFMERIYKVSVKEAFLNPSVLALKSRTRKLFYIILSSVYLSFAILKEVMDSSIINWLFTLMVVVLPCIILIYNICISNLSKNNKKINSVRIKLSMFEKVFLYVFPLIVLAIILSNIRGINREVFKVSYLIMAIVLMFLAFVINAISSNYEYYFRKEGVYSGVIVSVLVMLVSLIFERNVNWELGLIVLSVFYIPFFISECIRRISRTNFSCALVYSVSYAIILLYLI